MIFQGKKVIQGTWTGVGHGAEVFGREDARHFRRQLEDEAILGAFKTKKAWQSHPDGFAGLVGIAYHLYELPRQTSQVGVETPGMKMGSTYLGPGTISYCLRPTGTIYVSPHLNRQYPKIGLQASQPTSVNLVVEVRFDD